MKIAGIFILILLFISTFFELSSAQKLISGTQELLDHLENFSDLKVDQIRIELRIRQPLDHDNPATGHFYQRVFLLHKEFNKPVLLETEGYAARPDKISEITKLIDANQIIVEHRYFGESIPDSLDYQYLNIRQAAADHHRITQLFRQIYTGKWVTSGISKGG